MHPDAVTFIDCRSLAEAKAAVTAFLKKWPNGHLVRPLSAQHRNLIRDNSSILPETGTLNRELVLHIHTAQDTGNLVCRFHSTNDKRSLEHDVDGRALFGPVTGVEGSRDMRRKPPKRGQKKEEASDSDSDDETFTSGEPAYGMPHKVADSALANCGCRVEFILWDFYMFKSAQVTSLAPGLKGIVDGWNCQHLHPRLRALFISILKLHFPLPVTDLYQYPAGYAKTKDKDGNKIPPLFHDALYQLQKISAHLQHKIQGLNLNAEADKVVAAREAEDRKSRRDAAPVAEHAGPSSKKSKRAAGDTGDQAGKKRKTK